MTPQLGHDVCRIVVLAPHVCTHCAAMAVCISVGGHHPLSVVFGVSVRQAKLVSLTALKVGGPQLLVRRLASGPWRRVTSVTKRPCMRMRELVFRRLAPAFRNFVGARRLEPSQRGLAREALWTTEPNPKRAHSPDNRLSGTGNVMWYDKGQVHQERGRDD